MDTAFAERRLETVRRLHFLYGVLTLVAAVVAFVLAATGHPLQHPLGWVTLGVTWAFMGGLSLHFSRELGEGADEARVLGLFTSIVNLFNFPIGTVLGLYSFFVLTRPEVEALLGPRTPPPPETRPPVGPRREVRT